jgi:hypothetical protein
MTPAAGEQPMRHQCTANTNQNRVSLRYVRNAMIAQGDDWPASALPTWRRHLFDPREMDIISTGSH